MYLLDISSQERYSAASSTHNKMVQQELGSMLPAKSKAQGREHIAPTLDIMQKPNPVIDLLLIQNISRL